MKHTLLIIAVLIAFASCTKTKTNTVTVTKNDTTYISIYPTLIGTWQSSTGSSPIVFNASTYQVQTNPVISYIASPDTIYNISETNVIYPTWSYSISAHNDSLWLTPVSPSGSTANVYLRSH